MTTQVEVVGVAEEVEAGVEVDLPNRLQVKTVLNVGLVIVVVLRS